MDPIRLRQINDILDYDRQMNEGSFNFVRKYVMKQSENLLPYESISMESVDMVKTYVKQLLVLLESNVSDFKYLSNYQERSLMRERSGASKNSEYETTLNRACAIQPITQKWNQIAL